MPKTGGNTGSYEYSPAKRMRIAIERKQEEARWAALCGPVQVRMMTPEELAQRRAAGRRKAARAA